jgi:hypothetical protein
MSDRVIPFAIEREGSVTLWYVLGLPGRVFLIKEDAEAAARRVFPSEGPQANYARVFFADYVKESTL